MVCACILVQIVICASKRRTTFFYILFKYYFPCAGRVIIYARSYFPSVRSGLVQLQLLVYFVQYTRLESRLLTGPCHQKFTKHRSAWGRGTPFLPLLLPCPFTFPLFSPFPFLIHFTYFLLLSIPSLSTCRIVPLRFQAGGRRRRPKWV